MLKGLETLDLRCRAQAATAAELAAGAAGPPEARPRHLPRPAPTIRRRRSSARQMETGGTVLSLDLAGGKAAAFRFLDALEIVLISNNLGDAKSLVTHPATTTHQRLTPEQRAALGIGDGLVRFSVGLEDPADLLADLRARARRGLSRRR